MPPVDEHAASAPASRAVWGWVAFAGLLLALVLIPFFLFGGAIEGLAQRFLEARPPVWQVALLLGGLLAGDVVLPVPSSLVGTAAGSLLGFGLGTATSWTGMMVGCGLGYLIGARAGVPTLRRMAGEAELARVAQAAERHGPWFLLVFRAVPVLAEVSVVFAGTSRMSPRAFFIVCALANLGVSITYSAVGAFAAGAGSFLLFFAGMVLVPGLALTLVRRLTRRV
jgi:uncharacterized membrane protein YdjX (TVP38/TMEM64 family)